MSPLVEVDAHQSLQSFFTHDGAAQAVPFVTARDTSLWSRPLAPARISTKLFAEKSLVAACHAVTVVDARHAQHVFLVHLVERGGWGTHLNIIFRNDHFDGYFYIKLSFLCILILSFFMDVETVSGCLILLSLSPGLRSRSNYIDSGSSSGLEKSTTTLA